MKIAILSAGLDSVMRGCESVQRELFECLRCEDKIDECVLFKGDGIENRDEVVLKRPFRSSLIVSILKRLRGDNLYWEQLFFAIQFVLYCVGQRQYFDRVLVIEAMVAKLLYRAKKILPGTQVIFTHGVWMEPEHYWNIADKIHEVNIENYNRLIRFDKKKEPCYLMPHFIKQPVTKWKEKGSLRKKYGIKTKKVILSVGVIKSDHKRMHYVINEASKLSEEWTLVLCGSVGEQKLIERANHLLGNRFLHLYVHRDEMTQIYQLADVFVLAATQEGFGVVIIEAMQNKLPVILHDRELFRWILKDNETCIDLAKTGCLADFIKSRELQDNWFQQTGEKNYRIFVENYTWEAVREDYMKMILE